MRETRKATLISHSCLDQPTIDSMEESCSGSRSGTSSRHYWYRRGGGKVEEDGLLTGAGAGTVAVVVLLQLLKTGENVHIGLLLDECHAVGK